MHGRFLWQHLVFFKEKDNTIDPNLKGYKDDERTLFDRNRWTKELFYKMMPGDYRLIPEPLVPPDGSLAMPIPKGKLCEEEPSFFQDEDDPESQFSLDGEVTEHKEGKKIPQIS